MSERFTVIGGGGFIGRHVVERIRSLGLEVSTPPRDAQLDMAALGHVIYCAGVTGDFRVRRLDTVRAHSCDLAAIVARGDWTSLLYVSSTRLYDTSPDTTETASITTQPADPSHLYNISKVLGEALCLSDDRQTARVARLSHVFGYDESPNFLPQLLRSAISSGHISLRTQLQSERDYVSVDDVAALLPHLALHGRERIYNVASGVNTTTQALIDAIRVEVACDVHIEPMAPLHRPPRISVDRLRLEFPWRPLGVVEAMPQLLARYRDERSPSR